MRGVLSTEVRRGGALLVALALGVVAWFDLVAELPRFDPWTRWSSSWTAGAGWLNGMAILFGPIAAAVAAWAGGRERRLGVEELLAVVPRPGWQRHAATFAALGFGALAGLLLVAVAGIAAILPGHPWSGGAWQVPLLLGTLGVHVCVSWGYAAGRLVPRRLTAPVVGFALYVGNAVPGYTDQAWAQLAPVANSPFGEGARVVGGVAPLAVCWFVAIGTAALVAVLARRRRWALVPAGVAVAVAVPLLLVGPADRDTSWSEPDPQALRQVCTSDAPVVCVQQVHAGLLSDLTPRVRSTLAAAAELTPIRRVEEPSWSATATPDPEVLPLSLDGQSRLFAPGVARPAEVVEQGVRQYLNANCYANGYSTVGDAGNQTQEIALSLLVGEAPAPDPGVSGPSSSAAFLDEQGAAVSERLRADPAAARAWMTRYLAAARSCDGAELARLAQS